jgi:acetyl esterase/lipase
VRSIHIVALALAGDYYVPKAPGKYPVVVAVRGGGWQGGTKGGYRFWGPYLNQQGIALYAIDYRLSKPGQPAYPQEVQDVRAAVQFVKSKAADLKADPERVGLMGDSAGAHLAALTGAWLTIPRPSRMPTRAIPMPRSTRA